MSRFPSKTQILEFIRENPDAASKRDIARAFGIKGSDRVELKAILRELSEEGQIDRKKRRFADPDALPPVSVLRVLNPDPQGDIFAIPAEWSGTGIIPKILVLQKQGDRAFGSGDRILARLTKVTGEDHQYEGRLIRVIGQNASRILGVFRKGGEGGRVVGIEKGASKEWRVPPSGLSGAKDGELVEAEQTGPKDRLGLPVAKIVARLGDPSAPKAVSLIAIYDHEIPDAFPQDVVAEAEAAKPVVLGQRTDLRHLPLITIDPSDARDHDDACCALPDDDPKNQGGFILWIAIADVAHYVTPGSALDREARKRGNSTYFPDRVVPMLPDQLSGDLCSLHEGVERPCMAVEVKIDAQGRKLSHQFHRGFMNSPAALSYEEAQDAVDGKPNERTKPLLGPVLTPLFAAYAALKNERAERQPLELNLPERKIILSDMGEVESVNFRDRFDAHKLVEEFMILANVAAAETLIAKRQPLLFRVHEEPDQEKLNALRDTAQSVGLNLAKGQVLQTRHLNQLLNNAAGREDAELINLATLRSMTQAYYGPKNLSHFGLNLKDYAHFTSPIRRYADLIVHRALITAHGWGDDGLTPDMIDDLEATGNHISDTERRSMIAERDTTDRYLASYMSERVGQEFSGRIVSIAKFGVFVKLDDTGADGLLPMRELGDEYFRYDRDSGTLHGEDTGRLIELGLKVTVKLAEAVPITGGLLFELIDMDGVKIKKPKSRKRGGSYKRKGKSRKVTRRRK